MGVCVCVCGVGRGQHGGDLCEDTRAILAVSRSRLMTAHRATLDAAVHRPLALEAPIQGTLPAFFANTASGTHRTLLIIGSNLASGAEGCHLVIGVIDLDGATHQLAVHLPMATSALMTAGPGLAALAAGILHVIVGVMVTTNSA